MPVEHAVKMRFGDPGVVRVLQKWTYLPSALSVRQAYDSITGSAYRVLVLLVGPLALD